MYVDRAIPGEHAIGDDSYGFSYAVTLILTPAEVEALLADYQPDYAASPGVTVCRPPLRLICAKLAEVYATPVSPGGGT